MSKKTQQSQAVHTPGPWFVGEDRANGISILWRDDAMICPMRWTDGLNSAVTARVTADANLIAAAPDLYESCKELRDACAIAMQIVAGLDAGEIFQSRLREAGIQNGFGVRSQQAIAKVDGKEFVKQ